MKNTLRVLCLLMCLVLSLSLFACTKDNNNSDGDNSPSGDNDPSGDNEQKPSTVHANVGVLKGPTGVGAVKLADDSKNNKTQGDYTVSFYETTDVSQIVSSISNGSLDIAAVPINMASTLFAKTKSNVQVICANALGVLSIVGTQDITNISQLKGMTINVVGQASTPEYIIKYVLTQNNIDPSKDVTLNYVADANLAVAGINETTVAMIPEPAVSVNLSKNSQLRVLFNMTEEWNKVCDTQLIQGCLVVRKDFAASNPATVALFLEEYAASVKYVNENHDAAADLLVEYSIIANKTFALKAIPNCNCVCITGQDMKSSVSAMLNVLYQASPSSIGGALPTDDFYYGI